MVGAIILMGLGVLGASVIYRPQGYPLEFTAQQNVLRDPAVFHLDEPVNVEAVFINKTDQPVTATAAVHWVLVSPATATPTDIIQLGLLLELRSGCTELGFANKPPSQVVDLTRKLFAEGQTRVTWMLSGNNVVIVPTDGGQREFKVDSFSYVPDDVPLPKHGPKSSGESCDKP